MTILRTPVIASTKPDNSHVMRHKRSNRERTDGGEQKQQASKDATDRVASLHRRVGNQTVRKLHAQGHLQPKLELSQPEDESEREAERIADAVLPADSHPGDPAEVSREAQHSEPGGDPRTLKRARERELRSLQSGGRTMREPTKSFFEGRFERDFSEVRVHTGSRADRAARAIDAKAFTIGTDIAFRAGSYRPRTEQGKRLLAHELTHVIQQRPGVQRQQTDSDQRTQSDQSSDGFHETVYLASGKGLTSAGMDRIEERVRRSLEKYQFEFNDEWLIRDTEDGTKVLKLRWQPSWGGPPSLWMGPEKLAAYLRERFAEQSYEIADSPYQSSKQEVAFTKEERQWIREVMQSEGISLLFRTFEAESGAEGLPPVVLHRLSYFKGGGSGQAYRTDVAIARDKRGPPSQRDGGDGEEKESAEDDRKVNTETDFKGTLIHELFHFFTNQTSDLADELIVPRELQTVLVYPEKNGYSEYAFGWFVHPEYERPAHFDVINFVNLPDKFTGEGKPDYEPSPMPQSGKTISPEEDLARTLDLYLTSKQTRRTLREKYPLRFDLMENYFGYLRRLEEQRLQK